MSRKLVALCFICFTHFFYNNTLMAQDTEVGVGQSKTKTLSTIAIKFPIILYWDSIKVTLNNIECRGVEKYLDDRNFYFVFENLENGEYMIEHKSDFNETYRYAIKLEKDTILDFPDAKLKYKVVDIRSENLEAILRQEMIQLQITELGCHHLNKYYYEIYNGKKHIGVKSKSDDKIVLSKVEYLERVSHMILNAKVDYSCDDYTCSDYYTIKAGADLYSFSDCCVSEKLIQRLKEGTEANKRR